MNKIKILHLYPILNLFFLGFAQAATPINGLYSSVFIGYTFMPDNIRKQILDVFFNEASYNSGYNAGGRFGLQINEFRGEAEVTYINAKVHRFSANLIEQSQASGQNVAAFGMANVYYDFPEMLPAIVPFAGIGIGAGWDRAHFDNHFHKFIPVIKFNFAGEDTTFAYQGTLGLTYNFAENYALNAAYRYIGTTRNHALGKVFQANLGTVGVVYRFNENFYK